MSSYRKSFYNFLYPVMLMCVALLPLSCDIFQDDSNAEKAVVAQGYLYLIDRTTVEIVMLDNQLRELHRWNLFHVTNDSSIQGITYDGQYLWLSAAGSVDEIFQIDVVGDSLAVIKKFDAPPAKHGTVRDIAWFGSNLWALNSGSATYVTPAALYKLDPTTGEVLATYYLPSPDPRGLTYMAGSSDAYGKASPAGFCYTDITKNMVYLFRPDFGTFDTLFSAPTVPKGTSYIYPNGITFDGSYFWLVNSSNTADHLFKLNPSGHVESRFDVPYTQPGAIVYAAQDVRVPPPPVVGSVSPASGVRGAHIQLDVLGANFKPGTEMAVDFGTGIHTDSLRWMSTSRFITWISIDANATIGKRNVTVTNRGGSIGVGDSLFEVTLVQLVPTMWLVEQDLDSLYQIRIADSTILQKWDTHVIAPGGSPQGLAYDGTNIWLCASGTDKRLYKVNTSGATLSAISSIPAPPTTGTLRGIVWDNGSLWVAVSTTGKIYRVDPGTGTVLDSLSTPGIEPRGIAFANGSLYCNDTSIDSVFAYNVSSHTWRSVFATPTPLGGTTGNRFATGMTWDGHSFWIANSTTTFDNVYKVSVTGVVLQSFSSPRIGPAQITGIVYTQQ